MQIKELEELWREVYQNSKISKERAKVFYDKSILRKEFKLGQKVLVYDTRLHLFSGKLKSRWTSPHIVKHVFHFGAVTVENLKNNFEFKMNGQRLKLFFEFPTREESTPLEDTIYA